MSSKGASPLPNESNVTFRSATCRNHPSNPLINNQFRASGLNLAINENVLKKCAGRKREKGNKGDGSAEILRTLNDLISTLYQEKETTPKV